MSGSSGFAIVWPIAERFGFGEKIGLVVDLDEELGLRLSGFAARLGGLDALAESVPAAAGDFAHLDLAKAYCIADEIDVAQGKLCVDES